MGDSWRGGQDKTKCVQVRGTGRETRGTAMTRKANDTRPVRQVSFIFAAEHSRGFYKSGYI